MWKWRRDNPQSAQAGFTLLEVLVAVTIVAVSLVMIMRLHLLSLDTTIRAEDLTTAVLLAQTKMSDLGDFPEVGEEAGDFKSDPELERFHWVTSVVEQPLQLGTITVELRVMQVTILWLDGFQERSYTLENYGTRKTP